MSTNLTTVDFHGATLIAQRGATPAETLVAMKPVVEGMGLSWQPQHRKLTEHPVLSKGITELVMPTDGGPQAMTALPLSRLGFWLAIIQPNMVPDEDTRARVIAYQMECADALFAHFFSKTTAAKVHAPKRRTSRTIPRGVLEQRLLLRQIINEAVSMSKISKDNLRRSIAERYDGLNPSNLKSKQLPDAIQWMHTQFFNDDVKMSDNKPRSVKSYCHDHGMIRMSFTTTGEKAQRILAILNE